MGFIAPVVQLMWQKKERHNIENQINEKTSKSCEKSTINNNTVIYFLGGKQKISVRFFMEFNLWLNCYLFSFELWRTNIILLRDTKGKKAVFLCFELYRKSTLIVAGFQFQFFCSSLRRSIFVSDFFRFRVVFRRKKINVVTSNLNISAFSCLSFFFMSAYAYLLHEAKYIYSSYQLEAWQNYY